MFELEERSRGPHRTIEKILSISGEAGASIGILHNGKVAHTDNFRFRDHAQKQSPDAVGCNERQEIDSFVWQEIGGMKGVFKKGAERTASL
jgi:hypothetical protein